MENIPMMLKHMRRTHVPLVLFVFLLPILLVLCAHTATAEDLTGLSEEVESDEKITTEDIIPVVDGCADRLPDSW